MSFKHVSGFFALDRVSSFLLSSVDELFWYAYLLIIVVISFANTSINSSFWLGICSAVFLFSALYCGFVCFVKKTDFDAFYDARFVIILVFLMLLLGFFQQLILKDSYLNSLVFEHLPKPSWFNFTSYWNQTPERGWWALLGNSTVSTLFVLSLLLLNTRKRIKQLLLLILLVGTTHVVLAVSAKYLGFYLVDKASLDGHFNAARGLFVNRNHLAAFIILCLCPIIATQIKLWIRNKQHNFFSDLKKQVIRFNFLLLSLFFICILLSESRAAILSLLGCCGLYLWFLFDKSLIVRKGLEQNHYFVFAFACLLVLIGVFFGQGMVERFLTDGLTIGERSTQWLITWKAIKEEFFLGYGVGSYAIVFQIFREDADLRTVIYDQAHNDYLHIFLEQGFIG